MLRQNFGGYQKKNKNSTILLGITGTGGSGKSSLVDELVRRFNDFEKPSD
jgi:methylmalonyl-CoA mutase